MTLLTIITKFIDKKEFYIETNLIGAWLRKFYDDKNSQNLAWLVLTSADIQIQNGIYFTKSPTQSDIKQHKLAQITLQNIIQFSIYLAIRQAVEISWLNNKD